MILSTQPQQKGTRSIILLIYIPLFAVFYGSPKAAFNACLFLTEDGVTHTGTDNPLGSKTQAIERFKSQNEHHEWRMEIFNTMCINITNTLSVGNTHNQLQMCLGACLLQAL